MTHPPELLELDLNTLKELEGTVVVFAKAGGASDRAFRKVNSLTRGQVLRVTEADEFDKTPTGAVHKISVPSNLSAKAVLIVKLGEKPSETQMRRAGAKAMAQAEGDTVHLVLPNTKHISAVVQGASLRDYAFTAHKSDAEDTHKNLKVYTTSKDNLEADLGALNAEVEGVRFTRDLVNEPANVLTTTEFADRLLALSDLGLSVRVIEEAEMETLGMGSLLGVGQGSESPSKIVVMEHMGGGDEAPLALVGKGVVFDTGGISLKPASGMEDMTMDMGGAGVVAGVMKALALRKAPANVVGLVGLVENMPDARAQRPGDVVKSMKGDTIEVINTDAEGRLVLADVLWYAQETYAPSGVIDLATLTGAIIIGLGHENAGVFSNDDAFADRFLSSATAADEGAWRMPLGKAYDDMLKSRIADMKNVGGRAAGSITAAQFLQRFIKDDVPWIHLDIAGVASVKSATAYAPKGATGWGVRALNRMIDDHFSG
ncbi:MAG: leucyl aminopeptidase [Pseudomonadota bacterium]